MIKNNQDFFDKARLLISELRNTNNNEIAVNLEAAMKISTMNTEILGEIRIVVKDIIQKNNNLKITEQAQQLLNYVNLTFGC